MQLFGAGLQCLNCKATQCMGGGLRIRNVPLTSSDLCSWFAMRAFMFIEDLNTFLTIRMEYGLA